MNSSSTTTTTATLPSLEGPLAGASWDERFEQLKAFKAKAGHLRVPKGVAEPLRRWMNTQRRNFKTGCLSAARKEALETIGFKWVVRGEWETHYEALKDFVAQHQQVDVAYIKKFDKKLSIWTNRHKGLLTQGKLTTEQAAKLLALGVVPAVATERRTASEARQLRKETLREMATHREEHGHLQMQPSKDPASLYRRMLKLRHISVNRPDEQLRQQLLKMGAFERFPDVTWEAGFADWRLYVHLTGDYACEHEVPEHIGRWAESVRRHFAPGGDALQLPLAKRYVDAKSKDYISVRKASARLAAAGFGRPTRTLTEADVVCQKLRRLNGIETGQPLALRAVLRLLALRAERGTLDDVVAAQMARLGFEFQPKLRAWRPVSAAVRMSGALVKTPVSPTIPLLVGSSRSDAVQAARRHRSRPNKKKAMYPKQAVVDADFRVTTRQVVAVVSSAQMSPIERPAEAPPAFATVGTASLRGRRFARPANTTFFTAVDI